MQQVISNKNLVAYGIQQDRSDLRAHVCFVAGVLYVYTTKAGQACVKQNVFPQCPVRTNNIITARGYLVPPGKITGCYRVDIPDELLAKHAISKRDTTTAKGRKAVAIVMDMLADALFPLPLNSSAIEDIKLQYEGLDVLIAANIRIQVKCDYEGGEKHIGGTGNLFLQIAECNPFRRH
jgi:hypothetical protein